VFDSHDPAGAEACGSEAYSLIPDRGEIEIGNGPATDFAFF
jgi:hypothetical protein